MAVNKGITLRILKAVAKMSKEEVFKVANVQGHEPKNSVGSAIQRLLEKNIIQKVGPGNYQRVVDDPLAEYQRSRRKGPQVVPTLPALRSPRGSYDGLGVNISPWGEDTVLIKVGKKNYLAQEVALVPIKKSWEKQQNFVADASHELRTPLAVMQTNLELVLGNGEDTVESQAKWLENIQAENKRMTKLVNDLLFLARADSNQQLVEKIVFPLSGVIDGVASAYEPLARKKGVRLEVRLGRDILFYGDEGKIKQLAVILLDNAIKYTSSEGTVTVLLNQYDNSVELIVRYR
jgi:signal transduction histidine kinase